MRTRLGFILVLSSTLIAFAQSRGGNWTTFGGDVQRSGWAGADAAISKSTVKDLQLQWKLKLETQTKGLRSMMPPIVLGRLISYRGFKELVFVATNADIIYSIDADLGKLFWQKHLEYSTREPQVTASTWSCPGGLTAMPTMPPPAQPARGGRGAPAPVPAGPAGRGNAFIGGPASVYAISSDGRLHRLNTSTGDDVAQPVQVLPANVRAASLNMMNNVIYTVTSQGCNGWPDAVWAIDLNGEAPKAISFDLNGGAALGLAGPVIASDGAVFVQTADRLLALSARDLQLRHYFSSPNDSGARRDAAKALDMNVTSPVIFTYKNRELIVSTGRDSRLYLLDASSVGGDDHRSSLFRTPPLAAEGSANDRGIWGGLSSWEEMDGTRWVLAPVWGPLNPELRISGANGSSPNGAIVAFKVEEQAGKPVLTPVWASRDLSSPVPPVLVNGIVFALSAGEISRQVKESSSGISVEERTKGSAHATLYALDAVTGKELYSSRNLVTTPGALTGLTVANGRVYFAGADGVLYAFGMYMEH